MLTLYRDEDGAVRASTGLDLPPGVIWIDLLDPTDEERAFVESRARLRTPSRAQLSEIEASSRLIVEGDVLYLSTPVVGRGSDDEHHVSPAGFVLSPRLLLTIRYDELAAFDAVTEQIRKDETLASGVGVFVALLEAIVDRGADVLEHLGAQLEKTSRSVFRGDPSNPRHAVRSTKRLRVTLSHLGAIGERVSQARDVLLGVGRIASFASDVGNAWIGPEIRVRLGAVTKDIASLNDYEGHLANKVQFLLDAVLGFITIEQNDVFKVLTIASVAGIPPTVFAGIWGMNFKAMPELDWRYGYPLAVLAIVLSAVLPLVWFKVRGWF
ncbi:magnesium transporter CorA family protein [Alsobacter sp. KACC 23698]|uniref:Magnesium transporter CorA family protein n=1 Tax=Alsobacter sp. KACC 23698 TaxID=3149229 RepID=A0AAU7JMX9_9HYPH